MNKANITTREKVNQAAWALIESGTAPSRAKIRTQIGSGGSDATVADELNQFWPLLGSYIKESRSAPEIPMEFFQAFNEIVAQARKLAESEWQEERQNLRETTQKAITAQVESESLHKSAEDALAAHQAELELVKGELTSAAAVREKQSQTIKNAEQQVQSLKHQLEAAQKREATLSEEKAKEIDLAYHRAEETEERLTQLLEEQRTEKTEALAKVEEIQTAHQLLNEIHTQLKSESKQAIKTISSLNAKLERLEGVKQQLSDLEQKYQTATAQLKFHEQREQNQALQLRQTTERAVIAEERAKGIETENKQLHNSVSRLEKQISQLKEKVDKGHKT